MVERFFRATAIAGDLHLIDFYDWDAWKLGEVQYRGEAEVRWLTRTGVGERRVVGTVAELHAALEDSTSPRGIYLYVSERLIDEARRRWEGMKRARKR